MSKDHSAFERAMFSAYTMSNTSASTAPGLTAKKIRESMSRIDELLKPAADWPRVLPDHVARSPIDGMPLLGRAPIVTSAFLPAEQPAIQVRDIRLKDGTPLLSTQFLARENAWWKDQYGMRPVAFMIGDTLAVHPQVQAMLAKACKALDEKMLSVMLGRQP